MFSYEKITANSKTKPTLNWNTGMFTQISIHSQEKMNIKLTISLISILRKRLASCFGWPLSDTWKGIFSTFPWLPSRSSCFLVVTSIEPFGLAKTYGKHTNCTMAHQCMNIRLQGISLIIRFSKTTLPYGMHLFIFETHCFIFATHLKPKSVFDSLGLYTKAPFRNSLMLISLRKSGAYRLPYFVA